MMLVKGFILLVYRLFINEADHFMKRGAYQVILL